MLDVIFGKYCEPKLCEVCKVSRKNNGAKDIPCYEFAKKFPYEAARLMGYEVLEENMAYWIDNADSYVCSVCGFETVNPGKLEFGANKCPRCNSWMEKPNNRLELYCSNYATEFHDKNKDMKQEEKKVPTPKFKPGDRARIIGNNSEHGFVKGEIITVGCVKDCEKDGHLIYSCSDDICRWWYVQERDMEPVETQEKKLGEYTLAEASEICRRNTDCIASGCQFISGDGCILTATSPGMWDLDGKKKLTDKELNICRHVGAKWVSCDDDGEPEVNLWVKKPVFSVHRYFECDDCEAWISTIKKDVFPSLNPGDCIFVDEVNKNV